MNTHREIAYRLDPALWMREVLGIAPRPWQEKFLCAPRGASMLALTARQVGKTTAAAVGMAHSAMFMPGSLSVVACPTQQQSAEAVRKVKEMVLKAGATLVSDNVYALELGNGSRVKALPGSDDSVRGLTVDAWIVADEAARLTPELIAALRPMRAQRPDARFVMLSTAWSRTDPFWTAWASDDPSWLRFQVTVDLDATLYDAAYLAKERHALGEAAYRREFLGIPAAGQVSPFEWQLYERATQASVHRNAWEFCRPFIIAHDVGRAKDRSTAVVGGSSPLAPELVQVGQHHVGHGCEIDAGGLKSLGQPPHPRQVRELHPHPSVDEYGPATATHQDHVQRPLEHVRRQEHVLQPGRPDGRVDVVAQHRAWQR